MMLIKSYLVGKIKKHPWKLVVKPSVGDVDILLDLKLVFLARLHILEKHLNVIVLAKTKTKTKTKIKIKTKTRSTSTWSSRSGRDCSCTETRLVGDFKKLCPRVADRAPAQLLPPCSVPMQCITG